jgi:hypothetical protein
VQDVCNYVLYFYCRIAYMGKKKLIIYDVHYCLKMFCVLICMCMVVCACFLACVFFATAAIIHVYMLHVLFDIIRYRWFLLFALSMSNP